MSERFDWLFSTGLRQGRVVDGMAMANVTEHLAGCLQVKVPLPYSLKWVNAYLLPGEDGWTLIDPGLRTSEAENVWMETLSSLAIAWTRISRIVLTHHHPDHYGLAGWFQERTGAPVWMSDSARQTAELLWGEDETFSETLTGAFREHGLPSELTANMMSHLRGFHGRVCPQPSGVRTLTAGSSFWMGNREWEVIGGEGHAPGHLSFYDRERRLLICGDQVLPDISPNIAWMPDADPNPLGSYLASLQEMITVDVACAYPGHRDPFVGFGQRVGELLDHHERRLDKMLEWVGTRRVTAFEMCEGLFGVRLRGHMHHLRFALCETIAHLILLERRGILRRSGDGDEQIRFYK